MSKFTKKQKEIEKGVISGYKKIEDGVMSGYQKIEDTVVSGYKKVEDGAVAAYKKVENKFVDKFLSDNDDTETSGEQPGDDLTNPQEK